VKALPLDLGLPRKIRWDPGGGSLIVYAADDKGRPGFHRIDLETGSYTTIVRSDQLEDPTPRGHFDVSPDGRTIWFATSALDDVRWSLIAYDLHSGASRSITPVEWRVRADAMSWWLGQISLSPDGAKLAVLAPDTTSGEPWVGTIPTDGGPFTPLARLEGAFFGPEWTADGGSIVIWTGSPPQWTGWLIPADGGEPRQLELMEHVFPRGMKLHPDGRRITFLAGESRGEVWVMEGLGGEARHRAAGPR
jgi:Tol biopolymer transport system component